MKIPASWEVYLVTDQPSSKCRSTVEIVQAAIRGGVSVVQLREKHMQTLEFLEEGRRILAVLRPAGIPLIINDRIDLALALDADGVHLGPKDMPLSIARKILGQGRIIGFSVEESAQINKESSAYADYFAISPVFFTSTKDDISAPWGLEGLKKARSLTHAPLVAIGGVKLENTREIVAAGADCVAVVTAIVSAENPETATRDLLMEVRSGKIVRK